MGRRFPGRSAQVQMYRLGASVCAALPAGVGRRAAEAAGSMVGQFPLTPLRERRVLVRSHLRRVYGPGVSDRELERRVDDTFASYGRYWAESLRLPGLDAAEVRAGMASEGMERLIGALDDGRGAIVALPHLGGWEWAGTWLAQTGAGVSVVVEALEPPEVFAWFVGLRQALGMEVIPVGPGAGAACLAALRANRALCLLSDRVVGATPGIEVDFFGERTRLPAGPVTLALRTGAPLLPAAVYFAAGDSGHFTVVRPPLDLSRTGRLRHDVELGTQSMAGELEALIRRAPTQWHLLQPNWPSDRAAE